MGAMVGHTKPTFDDRRHVRARPDGTQKAKCFRTLRQACAEFSSRVSQWLTAPASRRASLRCLFASSPAGGGPTLVIGGLRASPVVLLVVLLTNLQPTIQEAISLGLHAQLNSVYTTPCVVAIDGSTSIIHKQGVLCPR